MSLFFFTALCAPAIAPYPASSGHTPFLGPCPAHLLGTDDMGYDILTQLIYGSRISLSIGVLAALISVLLGGGIGIAAGYFRRMAGELLTGIIDVFLLIPMLPLMVILTAYLGRHYWNLVAAIGILGWCSTARAVRAKVLQLRETVFVQALKGVGIKTRHILMYHIPAHVTEILGAKFSLSVAGAMLSEASLSFIGLGDPTAVSWGTMIHHAFKRGGFSNGLWTWYLPPGLCIGAAVFGFVLVGMGLELSGRPQVEHRKLSNEEQPHTGNGRTT